MVKKIMGSKLSIDQMQNTRSKRDSLIRKIYLHLLGQQTKISWKCLMFKDAARSKAYFIMYLMLYQRLSIVDRLGKWGLEVPQTCMLCQEANETAEHLLAQCQFYISLWNRMLTWIQRHSFYPSNWEQFTQWSIHHEKGRVVATHVFKIVVTECVYAIWMENL